MRKTRLVILPTKYLHQMGFLLLFLSCPVIGDWGRIRPETENAHIAIQRSREGTCGLQRDPSGALLNLWRKNLFDQCLKDANVDDYTIKPMLRTNSETRARESLIKLEKKNVNLQRNVKAQHLRISESRRQNVDQQRRVSRNVRMSEISQNRRLLNDGKVVRHTNNRISVRSEGDNAGFRRLSLARTQFSKNGGTRNDVLHRSVARLNRNDPERILKRDILKNSFSRRQMRSDKLSRDLNEKQMNRRNGRSSRSQLQIYDTRRQNDRTIIERFENRQLIRREAFNRQANEESMRRDSRQRNSRQEISRDFSRRTKYGERETLTLNKADERRDQRSSPRHLTTRRDNEIKNRRIESKSRRLLSKRSVEENIRQDIRRTVREAAAENQKISGIRQTPTGTSMVRNDRNDIAYAWNRNRHIDRLTEKMVTTVMPRTTIDGNIRINKKDTRRNIVFVGGIANRLNGEEKVRKNQKLRLNEYSVPKNKEEKTEDFMNSLLKWTTLNGYNISKFQMKDLIGNCFIGAAAYYLTSRQVKVV